MERRHITNEEKLDEIYELTRENHEILKTLRRQQNFATILRILYWLVVLGFIGGAYYFVRPVINAVSTGGAQVDKTINQIDQIKDQLPETKVLNQVLDWFKKSANAEQ